MITAVVYEALDATKAADRFKAFLNHGAAGMAETAECVRTKARDFSARVVEVTDFVVLYEFCKTAAPGHPESRSYEILW